MSLLQNEEFTIYRLRTSYLSSFKDGVGERLITVNPSVLNTPGFRASGWQPNPSDLKRTYSPPIPTGVASEYFQAPPRSAGLPPAGFGDDDDDGGMITGGGGSGDTVGPALVKRRRREREQRDDDDSSDLSDESDEEGDAGPQRTVQQIKFAKMPVRTRSGSSPILQHSSPKLGPSLMLTSPSRPPGESRLRSGSLGAAEAAKERSRRQVSVDGISSDNEFDTGTFTRRKFKPSDAPTASQAAQAQRLRSDSRVSRTTDGSEGIEVTSGFDDDSDDSGEESDGTTLSSDFAETADSTSLLDSINGPSSPSPLDHRLPLVTPLSDGSKGSSGPQLSSLQALPPPRPISVLQPVSALSQAIKAKRAKVASPLERFATLSGKGDPNRLRLMIYAPFSVKPSEAFEVPLRRTAQKDENGRDVSEDSQLGKSTEREVTVADALGFSLWRYTEVGLQPPIEGDKRNVNRWVLRMVEEDGEVDYDFPPLERTRSIAAFCSNNQRAARSFGRVKGKNYDEFALVEATKEQFDENERLTPSFSQDATNAGDADELAPQAQPMLNPTASEKSLIHPSVAFGPSHRQNSITPIDAPQPSVHATPRTGPSKILRIHVNSLDAYAQTVSVDVTTDTYMAEVLDIVCRKNHIDKAHHVLKIRGTNAVVLLDRTVEWLGAHTELDLFRRRFGDGLGDITGSPQSLSPNASLLIAQRRSGGKGRSMLQAPIKDVISSAGYQKFTVWRKQPMSFIGRHERVLAIDGEYVHIMPSESGKTIFESSPKTTSIHMSTIVGCKSSGKVPSNFKIIVMKSRESKRYDYEAQNAEEASQIVAALKKGMETYKDVGV